MTGQINLDRYRDAGVFAALELVNGLAISHAYGRPVSADDPLAAIADVLSVDPPSVAELDQRHVPAFVRLARRLRDVFAGLADRDVDAAAELLNELLGKHPAHPHLAKEGGVWRMHHHPADAALVPMWTSICAEALARMIDAGFSDRLGTCAATDCERVYFDTSRNGSRRFCSTACQNRMKMAAFRRRRSV